MAQREWVEKDFYKELGVASDASQDEIKRAARKILAENHPDLYERARMSCSQKTPPRS